MISLSLFQVWVHQRAFLYSLGAQLCGLCPPSLPGPPRGVMFLIKTWSPGWWLQGYIHNHPYISTSQLKQAREVGWWRCLSVVLLSRGLTSYVWGTHISLWHKPLSLLAYRASKTWSCNSDSILSTPWVPMMPLHHEVPSVLYFYVFLGAPTVFCWQFSCTTPHSHLSPTCPTLSGDMWSVNWVILVLDLTAFFLTFLTHPRVSQRLLDVFCPWPWTLDDMPFPGPVVRRECSLPECP